MDIKTTILIVTVANLLVAFLVFIKNRRSRVHLSFSAVAITLSLWSASMFLYEKSLFLGSEVWIKVVWMLVILLMLVWAYFFTVFLKREKSKINIFNLIGVPIWLWVLLKTDWWIKGVSHTSYGVETNVGWAYAVFGLHIGVVLAWITVFIIKKYLSSSNETEKRQLIYIFTGTITYSVLATVFDVIIPILWHNSRFFWISSYFSLFFVVFTALAIFKHRLFEIKAVLIESLVFIMGAVFLLLPIIARANLDVTLWILAIFIVYCFIGYTLIRYTRKEAGQKEYLEAEVARRTQEIRGQKEELEKFYRLTVGRELRMVELKKKIKDFGEK